MDKFTGRRRAGWQSKAPLWPFLLVAFPLVMAFCLLVGPLMTGLVLGDGTAGGHAMVWFKTFSNIMVPPLLAGVVTGFLLHQILLAPSGRHGAMMWTGLLIMAGAVAGAPLNLIQGYAADRVGYAITLDRSVAEARTASRRAEQDFYRRLDLLLTHNPFDPADLASSTGLEDARQSIAGHRDLIAAARRDYEPGQDQARAALAAAIVDEMDREAVLERFDAARVERKALMDKVLAGHARIADLRDEELKAMTSNRGAWRKNERGVMFTSESLFNRVTGLERGIQATVLDIREAEDGIATLDAETDAGIHRVLVEAV